MSNKSLEERIGILEAKVRTLEDIQEISKVMAKYCYTMDNWLPDRVMSCFAKECSADFGDVGICKTRAEVEDFFRNRIGKTFVEFSHQIANEIIEVKDEKTATGRWYLDESCILQKTKNAAMLECLYCVFFIKEDGHWFIKHVACREAHFISDYDKGWAKERFTISPGKLTEPSILEPL